MLKKALIIAAVVLSPVVATTAVSADHNENHNNDRVYICHATNSADNPYVYQQVNVSSVDGVGNGDHYVQHNAPVVPTSLAHAATLKDQGIEWGDIIAPVPGFHNGLNWNAQTEAFLASGCQFEGEEPSPILSWNVECALRGDTNYVQVTITNEGDAEGGVIVNSEGFVVGSGESAVRSFADGTQVTISINEQVVYDQVVDCSSPEESEEEGEVLGVQSNDADDVSEMPETGAGTTAAIVAVATAGATLLVATGKAVLGKFGR